TGSYFIDDLALDTVAAGDGGNAFVSDTLHVSGSTSFGGATLLQTNANTSNAFQVRDSSGNQLAVLSTSNYAGGANAANATLVLAKDSGTNRSINAAGTINASGADYAEYFYQAIPGALQSGDVVCMNASGTVEICNSSSPGTLIGAVSTNAGYVGND